MATAKTAWDVLGVSREEAITNLLTLFADGSPEQIQIGMEWYANAHDVGRVLNHRYERGLEQTIGTLAACSPQSPWLWSSTDKRCNVYKAIQVLASATDSKPKDAWVTGAIWKKARRIAAGEYRHPMDAMGKNSHKVKWFYDSILTRGNGRTPCVDTHMMNAMMNGITTERQRQNIFSNAMRYGQCAEVIQVVADTVGIPPQQMQAILWTIWRDANGKA